MKWRHHRDVCNGHIIFDRIKDKVTKTRVRFFDSGCQSVFIGSGPYSSNPSCAQTLYYQGNNIRLLPGFRTSPGQTVYIGPNITIPPGAEPPKWIETVSYYDQYGRGIQSQSKNHLGGLDVASTQYDFSGKVLRTKLTHRTTNPANEIIVRNRFTYDHAGRPVLTYQNNNNEGEVLISKLEYNELGQVVRKYLHNLGGNSFLQTMNYTYNIRG